MFFPVSDTFAGDAKAICATCPVAEQCLEYAIETHQSDGVWGGLTAVERHRLVRRRQKAARESRSTAAWERQAASATLTQAASAVFDSGGVGPLTQAASAWVLSSASSRRRSGSAAPGGRGGVVRRGCAA